MASFNNRGTRETGFSSIGSPSPQGTSGTAQAAAVASTLIQTGASIFDRQKQARDSASKQAILDDLENDLLDAGAAEVASQPETELDAQAEDIRLTDAQVTGLNTAQRAARKLDLLEQQSGVSNRINQRRVSLFRQFKEQHPELAPELREFFNQQVGATPIELAAQTEEDMQEQARKTRAAERAGIDASLKELNVWRPGMSDAEAIVAFVPIQAMLAKKATSNAILEQLKLDRDIPQTQRQIGQAEAYRQEAPSIIAGATSNIRGLIAQANPNDSALTQDLVLQIENMKAAITARLKTDYDLMPQGQIDSLLGIVNDIATSSIDVIRGKSTSEQLQNQINIANRGATADIVTRPGFARSYQMFKMLNDLQFVPKHVVAKSAEEWGVYKLFTESVATPTRDRYSDLLDEFGPAEAQNAMTATAVLWNKMAEKNLDNPDAIEPMTNILLSHSKFWDDPNAELPVQVGDAYLEMTSNPYVLKLFKDQSVIPTRLNEMTEKHIFKMQQSLAGEMSKPLNASLPGVSVVPSGTRTNMPLLSQLADWIGVPLSGGRRQATLLDVVSIRADDEGRVTFFPEPSVRSVPGMNKVISTLNSKYADRMNKFVRSQAHLNQNNTDYSKSLESVLTQQGFTGLATPSTDTVVIDEAETEEIIDLEL